MAPLHDRNTEVLAATHGWTDRKELNLMTEVITPTVNGTRAAAADSLLREQAVHALKKKRDFRTHLLAYVLVNAFLWLVWGVVYAAAGGPWFPWPVFPLFGWGIGLAFHAWDAFGRRPFSDAEIEREIRRLRPKAGKA